LTRCIFLLWYFKNTVDRGVVRQYLEIMSNTQCFSPGYQGYSCKLADGSTVWCQAQDLDEAFRLCKKQAKNAGSRLRADTLRECQPDNVKFAFTSHTLAWQFVRDCREKAKVCTGYPDLKDNSVMVAMKDRVVATGVLNSMEAR
jgi:hypothetical protein